MDKNRFASTPPMGWNSWDCYGAAVNEEQLLGNAAYMRDHLKAHGWEYVVCDIQWYEPTADSTAYHAFAPLTMDTYGRLLPAPNRFPSARGGAGFGPVAEKIHAMGLKFGVHMMRGVPRQAVHTATPILGAEATARDIAHPFSLCSWNTDMYGVNPGAVGAQAYYDSVFAQYAQWGVDFVKVDDICVTEFSPDNRYSAREEIELIARAIQHCGRAMVLSLSPGPAPLQEAGHLAAFANMWRITGDFWDNWGQLLEMFGRCAAWAPHVREGCWPDCDMLPLGHLSLKGCEHGLGDRWTRFSREEQRTMMTLWCLFRSPLMMGGELRDCDGWTLSLLQNDEVLRLLSHSRGAREVMRAPGLILWQSEGDEGGHYAAVFNTDNVPRRFEIPLEKLGLAGALPLRDLWARENRGEVSGSITVSLPAHGAALYRLG